MAYPDECAGTNVTDESIAGAVSTPTNNKHGTAMDADKELGNDADATSAAKPLSGARLRAGWPTSDDGRTGEGTDERCCERQN